MKKIFLVIHDEVKRFCSDHWGHLLANCCYFHHQYHIHRNHVGQQQNKLL